MKTLLGLALASVIIIPAQAAMRAPSLVGDAPIIRVEGGCGPYEFRSPDGFCRRKEESRRELRHEERREERRREARREERREEHREWRR
jgi:hypothetical protein